MSAKDSGYAWVILAASAGSLFVVALVTIGSVGAMFVEVLAYFPEASKTDVSWLGSIQILTLGLGGFFLGPRVKKYGSKPIAFFGALLSALGLVGSSFVTNLRVMYFTYAFLTGVGSVCGQIGSLVIVQNYFDKRRALAVGICFCSISLGTIVGPPLTVLLVQRFALPGTFIMLAALHLQCLWLSALFRRPPHQTKAGMKALQKEEMIMKVQTDKEQAARLAQPDDDSDLAPPIQKSNKGFSIEEAMQGNQGCCMTFFGLYPCKNLSYIFYMLAVYLQQTGHILPLAYLPLRGVSIGETETKAALLVTILGVTAMICRLVAGLIGDLLPGQRRYICALSILGTGIVSMASYFFNGYLGLVVYAFAFGAISASYTVLQHAVVVDFWGQGIVELFTGHAFLLFGVAMFTMNPISAMMVDATGNVGLPFLVFGFTQSLGGISMFISAILQCDCCKKQKRRNSF